VVKYTFINCLANVDADLQVQFDDIGASEV